jgi:hypothetical protein
MNIFKKILFWNFFQCQSWWSTSCQIAGRWNPSTSDWNKNLIRRRLENATPSVTSHVFFWNGMLNFSNWSPTKRFNLWTNIWIIVIQDSWGGRSQTYRRNCVLKRNKLIVNRLSNWLIQYLVVKRIFRRKF